MKGRLFKHSMGKFPVLTKAGKKPSFPSTLPMTWGFGHGHSRWKEGAARPNLFLSRPFTRPFRLERASYCLLLAEELSDSFMTPRNQPSNQRTKQCTGWPKRSGHQTRTTPSIDELKLKRSWPPIRLAVSNPGQPPPQLSQFWDQPGFGLQLASQLFRTFSLAISHNLINAALRPGG